jgi:hypothetical protein
MEAGSECLKLRKQTRGSPDMGLKPSLCTTL